jgi:hypothetical protein
VDRAGPGGAIGERRIWFAGAATPSEAPLSFPRLALPVFMDSSGAEAPFTIRVQERGCVVEGITLTPRRAVCFAALGAAAPRPGRIVRDAVHRDGSRARAVGTLRTEDPVPASAGPDAPPPPDPRRASFERFLEGRVLFGWLDGAGEPVGDVTAPGLADARVAARLYVRGLD